MKFALLDALGDKMRWHQARQTLLAENVANADTPGYRGRDLKAFSFEDTMRSQVAMSTTTTQAGHISIAATGGDPNGFGVRAMNSFEITPEGNGVTLEDEMMKVASNQMDYQSITALYTRSLNMIKTALGKQV
ncbi:MAG: flagellar basal body rod protein FlgB [Devosia sp.]